LPSSHYTQKEVSQVVTLVFEDWINHRGGAGNIEIKQAIENLLHLLKAKYDSNQILEVISGVVTPSSTPSEVLGYKCSQCDEIWIYPEIFKTRLCKGVNPKQFINALQDKGILLKPDNLFEPTIRRTLNSKQSRFYAINMKTLIESF
jgi:hypothetical protein